VSETASRTSVTVQIAGEDHTIRSNADPDYTRRCAEFVDDRITEILERSGLVEAHKAAILAALSITDQFLQARDELERFRKEVASRASNLTRRVEDELSTEPQE
jgi:cell division protein ZapA